VTISLDDIQSAAAALAGQVLRTPLVEAPALGALIGADLRLKLENLQLSGSFKARGALNRLLALSAEERRAGVIAMSAGNHAQGVAWHARRLGIPAVIVVPQGTPFTKIERTEALGARVVVNGPSLTEAGEHAQALAEAEGYAFIHSYDDPLIIAGQGTVGLEILEDAADLDAIVVPIGGGGLIAGIATAVKALKPSIEIIGVQCEMYPSMKDRLDGTPARSGGQTIAEGIAVKAPGVLTLDIVRKQVSDILLVGEPAIERAILTLLESQKIVAEGAGAAPLAAVLANPERFRGRKVALVISGGNIDARLIASILLRGLARAGHMARLRIEIPDAPGMLARVAKLIGEGDGNIIEITHQRMFHDVPVKYTDLDAVIETTSVAHVHDIVDLLRRAGFPTRLLSSTAEAD
jgi:threonine dehydratase